MPFICESIPFNMMRCQGRNESGWRECFRKEVIAPEFKRRL